ncbi:hypothetical protein ACPYO6_15640 [Georgenia sp. Z1344]|uniref:hypothetical protein n=1 Tax=Georgenia sp. Z1344 TaxID=3416706 RepID=UPI003CE6FE1C
MSSPLRRTVPLVALALALAGCGGSTEDDGSASPPAEAPPDDADPAGDDTGNGADAGSPDAVESASGEAASDGAATGEALPADGSGADEPTDAPATEEPGASIRDVDLAAQSWRQALTGESVVPAEGDGLRQFTVSDAVAYADVDGDGHEDAAASLQVLDGNAYEETWYVWRWDPESQAAVQVESPIARQSGCGDDVLSVTGEGEVFVVVEELRPAGSAAPCVDGGTIPVTRQVTLEDGWPVLAGGMSGEGGICPQVEYAGDEMWPAGDVEIHAAPTDGSAPIGEPAPDWWMEVDVSGHHFLWRPNWMLVHLMYDEQPAALAGMPGYFPCAWAYIEDDQRPVPHAPYVP